MSPILRSRRKPLWWIVLLLIVASWVGNLWYYKSMQLEKPIFLKHYIELNGAHGDWIELTYVENKMAGKKVTGIQLEELPMLRFQITPNRAFYRHQVLGKAYGEWRKGDYEQMERLPILITEATVYYSEGPPEKIPIGEIQINWEENGGLTHMSSSMGSTNGRGQYSATVKESLILEHVDTSFSDRFSPIFELSTSDGRVDIPISGRPVELDAGDSLTFTYNWNLAGQMPAAADMYKVYMTLTFRTEDGRVVRDRIPLNFNLYLSEKHIKWLVRSGGELH